MMRVSGNIDVNGIDFEDWFNSFRARIPSIFPYFIVKPNFRTWIKNISALSGKPDVSLAEFVAHFAICYNETGGTFYPIREYGGSAYFFNNVTLSSGQIKPTYNRFPNRLAGNQLKARGVISTDTEVAIWNGSVYPESAPNSVKIEAENCDYHKFAGYGFNQLTWYDNFKRCLEPHLPKPLDSYTTLELNKLIVGNNEIACRTYHSFITQNRNSQWAITEAEKANFVPYGNLVSGNWAWYVQNQYLPRCVNLYNALQGLAITEDAKKYAIDGLNLTRERIKSMQLVLMAVDLNTNNIIKSNGGADGAWGDATEKAFQISKLSIDELVKKSLK